MTTSTARPAPMALLLLATVLATSACDLDLGNITDICDGPCPTPPPQDCADLSGEEWVVGGLLTAPELEVSLGGSSRISLWPVLEAHCEGTVVSVGWHVDDPSLLSLEPDGRYVWVTGVRVGVTMLGARVAFADGTARDARRRPIRVVDAGAPQGELIAEGDLTIPPLIPPGTTADWHGWVPFTTSRAGRIDVVVDWESPLNRLDFSGYEGHCNAAGACGTIRMTLREHDVEPLHASFDDPRTPPGDYTIRIDNLGPGEEAVHYVVRLLPS